MKNKGYLNSHALYIVLMASLTLAACKKSKTPAPDPVDPTPVVTNTKQTPTTNRAELTNDSIFLYAKEIYFWNTSLPTYDAFEPRKYGSGEANYKLNLYNLVKTSGSADYVSTATVPNNKYSYIFNTDNANPDPTANVPNSSSSVDLEGNGHDIGIYSVSPIGVSVNGTFTSYKLYISAIFENSPAFTAGLTRGAYITEINGVAIGAITPNSTTIPAGQVEAINAGIYRNPASSKLKGFKADGTAFDVTLEKASYKSNPIYKTNVLTAGTKKIGYIAYARFSNTENSVQALTDAFNNFADKSVTDLVVDLRYNGGGYVSTAEHLINLIAPSTANGVMYVEHYNNNLKNRARTDATILSNQPLLDGQGKIRYDNNGKMLTYADIDYSVAGNTNNFSKVGKLTGVKNIVFIVSGSTASASELVINALKPHMTVQLVGTTTYGKPIGFFPVTIEGKYEVYLSLFETKNSLGQGEYYSGFKPNVDFGEDGVGDSGIYDFGNPLDEYLTQAVKLISPNVTAVVSANKMMGTATSRNTGKIIQIGQFGAKDEFQGMIETRHKIHK